MLSHIKAVGSLLVGLFGRSLRNGKQSRRDFLAKRARLSLEQLEDRINPVTITWTGGGVNELWSTGGNWDLNRAPVAADDILFKNTSAVDSTEDINFQAPVKSLSIIQYTGIITFNVPLFQVLTMQQTSGTITGNGQIRIVNGVFNGSFDWSGGMIGSNAEGSAFQVYLSANATMTIQGALDKTMNKVVFQDYGTVTWKDAGKIIARGDSIFFVGSGGVFNGDAGTAEFDGNQEGFINTFQVGTGGTYNENNNGQHDFKAHVVLNGTWNVNQGISFFTKNSTVQTATINITQFGGLNLIASQNTWDGVNVTGLGWLSLAGLNDVRASLVIWGNVTVSMLQQVDSIIDGTGNLIITRDYVMGTLTSWAGGGTITINPQANFYLYRSQSYDDDILNRRLINNGTAQLDCDDLVLASGKDMTNNGTLSLLKAFTLTPAAGGGPAARLINNGTMNAELPAQGVVSIELPFTNSGVLNVKSGTIEFTLAVTQTAGSTNLLGGTLRSYEQYNIQAGMLTGVGTIQTLELRNSGLVRLGSTQSPLGDLTIATLPGVAGSGRYVQTNQGTLNFSLGGTQAGQYNRLHVQGQASLGGILTVTVVAPYNPQVGDTFNLMDFASLDPNANQFATTPAGWNTAYPNGTGVRIIKN